MNSFGAPLSGRGAIPGHWSVVGRQSSVLSFQNSLSSSKPYSTVCRFLTPWVVFLNQSSGPGGRVAVPVCMGWVCTLKGLFRSWSL
jgi:hypothetical protein